MANVILDMDLEHPALDENIRDWVKVFSTLYCWTLYCWSTPSPPTPSLGGTLYCAYTGRIRPKGVPFSSLRYFRGFISIREGNFVNLVYKEHPALDETIRNWVKEFSTLKSCIVGPHPFLDYSPIFTSPEATNCFSINTLMIIRENKIIHQFLTPKHQQIFLPFWKLPAFNVIITARWL